VSSWTLRSCEALAGGGEEGVLEFLARRSRMVATNWAWGMNSLPRPASLSIRILTQTWSFSRSLGPSSTRTGTPLRSQS
jgi:hypothetical protein